MKKILSGLLRYALGIVIVIVLIYKVGVGVLYSTISKMPLWLFPLIAVFYVLNFLLSSINIKLLLNVRSHKIKFFDTLACFVVSWSLGLLLPAKIGDFSMPFLLKKHRVDLGTGFAAIFTDRLISFLVVYLLASAGIVSLFGKNSLLYVFAAGATIFALLLMLRSGGLRNFASKYILKKYFNITGFYKTLLFYSGKKRLLFLNFSISLVNILLSALVIYTIFISYGSHISFLTVLLLSAMVKLVALLPITPGGIGVKEAAAIQIFSLVGVSSSLSASVFLTVLIFNYSIAFVATALNRI